MKTYTLLLISLFPLYLLSAQPVYKGIVLKDIYYHNAGDTIDVFASKTNSNGNHQFLVENGFSETYVGTDKVKLIEGQMDYWTKIWFENRAAHIHKNGWDLEHRKMLEREFKSYAAKMEENNLVVEDETINDYVKQLVQLIHPGKLIRPEEKQIGILILKSPETDIFAFNCGIIVMTTGRIAAMEDEEELVRLLSQYVAHLVMEDELSNLVEDIEVHRAADVFTACATVASAVAMGVSNIRSDTDFGPEDVWFVNRAASFISHALVSIPGPYYPYHQISDARHHAAVLISDLKDQNIVFLRGSAYTSRIAPVLRSLAWQCYYEKDYENSGKYLDRLFTADLQNEEDYLLLAKLYRRTAANHEELQRALDAINKAEECDDFNFVEVLYEKGMILYKMENYTEAKVEFDDFLSVTAEVGGDPDQIEKAGKMSIRCKENMDE